MRNDTGLYSMKMLQPKICGLILGSGGDWPMCNRINMLEPPKSKELIQVTLEVVGCQ